MEQKGDFEGERIDMRLILEEGRISVVELSLRSTRVVYEVALNLVEYFEQLDEVLRVSAQTHSFIFLVERRYPVAGGFEGKDSGSGEIEYFEERRFTLL